MNLKFTSLLAPGAALLLLSGCAHHYQIKLSNGAMITTASKPKLRDGGYHFKDSQGHDRVVPAGRVTEIEPASMAQEESKSSQFKPQAPKKKHWYWPF